MSDLALGPLMKEIREGRLLSLKEAAGEAISPQNLSRFEKGDSMIKADTFLQVVNHLSFDGATFLSYLNPLPSSTRDWAYQLSELLHQGRYSKLIEEARNLQDDKSTIYYKQLLRVLYQTASLTKITSRELLTIDDIHARQFVIKHLQNMEIWTATEFALYKNLLRLNSQDTFSLPFIAQKEKEVERLLKKQDYRHNLHASPMLFDIILATIEYYLSTKHLDKAAYLIERSKTLSQRLPLPPQLTITLYTLETVQLLQTKDEQAFQVAQKTLDLIDALDNLTESNTYEEERLAIINLISQAKPSQAKPSQAKLIISLGGNFASFLKVIFFENFFKRCQLQQSGISVGGCGLRKQSFLSNLPYSWTLSSKVLSATSTRLGKYSQPRLLEIFIEYFFKGSHSHSLFL